MIDKVVLLDAISTWSAKDQIMMAYEEMAELQKELCKNYRGKDNDDHIAEEIADVEIMLEQLKIIYDCETQVEYYHEKKIERLKKRLAKAHLKN